MRGGRPITQSNKDCYTVTAPASTRFNAQLPKLIEIDPADVRCEHDDVRVDFFGTSFQIYTPAGKLYLVPKSEVSVLDRFSSKELERLLKDRFYILTVKATYDGTEIKYTINARFSPPSVPGDIFSRASLRSARMAGRPASYSSMASASESKEEPVSTSVSVRSTHARHPKVFLTAAEWDGLIEELRVGEAKFQVAKDEYIKVSSRVAGEFYIQVADLKWMQVTREQGLSHIDFEIASLVPFAGKPVVNISKVALARLAARKAAAEAGTKLTSVAARAAESSAVKSATTPVVWESWARLPKVEMGGKIYAKIGDRLYTRHAIDRAVPKSLGWPAGADGPGRGIGPRFIEKIIQNPERIDTVITEGVLRTIYRSGDFSIVTEQNGKVLITILRETK